MKQQKNIKLFGAILAGGKATRMGGAAKGNLPLAEGNATIVSHQLCEFNKIGINNIVISANDDASYAKYGASIVHDQRLNFGPLGGIISVLDYFKDSGYSDFSVFFLPCDLPNITSNELAALKNFYLESNAPIVFASSTDGDHPLCTIVNAKVLPQLRDLVFGENIKKVMQVWRALDAVPLAFANQTPFLNVNAPDDFPS
jgi:molybdenum cofactor guanylyltransferase